MDELLNIFLIYIIFNTVPQFYQGIDKIIPNALCNCVGYTSMLLSRISCFINLLIFKRFDLDREMPQGGVKSEVQRF